MSEKPLVVIGAGGNALVIVELLRAAGRTAVAVVAKEDTSDGALLGGVPVIGGDKTFMKRFGPDDVELVNGLGSVGDTTPRQRLYERYVTQGYTFATILHPSAVVADEENVGVGSVVMAGAIVQPGAVVGENVLINSGAIVEHGCRIGAHTHVATGAILCGDTVVGEGAHVGAGATTLQGKVIGAGAVVAAGAVVIDNVADKTTVAGVPARVKESKR